MTSALGLRLRETETAERRTAVRALLASPIVFARVEPEVFATVLRHERWLVDWFREQAGWRLRVDHPGGFARLYKVPGRPSGRYPATAATGRRRPFDKRRYTLLCLTLAVLEDGAVQTTLGRLAEQVVELGADDEAITALDPNRHPERRAFVDVLHWLTGHRVLTVRDGDAERFVRSREGDVLYDVNDRLLAQLIAAPRPPAMAGRAGELLREPYPESAEGRRMRARHHVTRRLLDEPVVYEDELDEASAAWLQQSRGHLYRLLEQDCGLDVERRREGLAAVDPEGRLTNERFPDGNSTAKHAALLLAEYLAERGRRTPDITIPEQEIADRTAALIDDYAARCGWSKAYTVQASKTRDGLPAEGGRPAGSNEAPAGAEALARDALAVLERFGLVCKIQEGWRPRPAIARFLPDAPRRSAT